MKPYTALALLSSCLVTAQVRAQIFNFAGYSWDQKHTADQVEFLGEEASLGGAYFSPGLPSKVTRGVQFPTTLKSFDATLAIGSQDPQLEAPRALNLPLYNDGTLARHGVAIAWSENRAIPNLRGEDFAIFESGEHDKGKRDSRGPELFMVRVRNGISGAWSHWMHKATGRFQPYKQTGRAGAFATGFDLDQFGIRFGSFIDRIEIANMTGSDRLVGENAPYQGRVVFEPLDGAVPPKPKVSYLNSYDENLLYGPDILYVATLHKTIANPLKKKQGAYVPPHYDEPKQKEHIQLLATKGRVDLFEHGTFAYIPIHDLTMGSRILPGYSIVTSPESAATLQLPGGAVVILQPGSLLSFDNFTLDAGDAGDTGFIGPQGAEGLQGPSWQSHPTGPTLPEISVNLIRGAFILINQSKEGKRKPVSLTLGTNSLNMPSGGNIVFQSGKPLFGPEFSEPWHIRELWFRDNHPSVHKRYFNQTTQVELPEPPANPVGPKVDPDPDPEPEPPIIPDPSPLVKDVEIPSGGTNPSSLPFSFSPQQLAFQGLGFLQNPVIPDGTASLFDSASGAPLDPNSLRGLLIPGFNQDPVSNAMAELAGNVDLDGRIMLNDGQLGAFASDTVLQTILTRGSSTGDIRLMADQNGVPFIVSGGQAYEIPTSVQQLLQDNPSISEFLKISDKGVYLQPNQDGTLNLELGEDGVDLLTLSQKAGSLQVSQDENGNLVFLGEDGTTFGDVLAPGAVGNPELEDEKVIKTSEGREGQLRRAHAQRVAKTAASKQAQRNALYRKQQLAAQQAKQMQKLAQQRAARLAAEKSKAAMLRKQQAARK